jgi:oligosaccharide repeat unit polymerase
VYLALLHFTYVYLIAPQFSYMRMGYSPVADWVVPWSLLIALVPVVWLPLRSERPSLIVYYMLYMLVVVPACLVPAYAGDLEVAELLRLQLSLVAVFGLLGLFYKVPLLDLPQVKLSNFFFCTLILGLSALCYVTIMYFAGLPRSLPSLFDVYGLREAFKSITGPFVLDYAMDWQSNVINPYLIARGLVYKKPVFLVIGLLGQLFIYGESANKAVFFSGLFCIALYFLLKLFRRLSLGVLFGLTLFVGLCIVADLATHDNTMSSLFVRREMFSPGLLTSQYFDFFSHNPHVMLGHSVLKGFVTYPYAVEPAYLIGDFYFGHANMSANANLWADGYANFGYAGFLLVSLILGCWLWLLDSSAQGRNRKLMVLMVGIPSLVLADTALLTSFANHGLLLLLLLIYLMPDESPQRLPVRRKAGWTRLQPAYGRLIAPPLRPDIRIHPLRSDIRAK